MKIFVGLGNIGDKYVKTRHNAGFIVLDNLAKELEENEGLQISWKEEPRLKAITAKIPYKDQILLLVKPTTLMNLSGQSVSAILNFFKEPIENLVVIYDDIDLPLGKVRVRENGSAGTHNGMKSIIADIGSQEFKRIRIGIESRGEHSPEHQDLHSFVLTNFNENEIPELKEGVIAAIDAIKTSIKQN